MQHCLHLHGRCSIWLILSLVGLVTNNIFGLKCLAELNSNEALKFSAQTDYSIRTVMASRTCMLSSFQTTWWPFEGRFWINIIFLPGVGGCSSMWRRLNYALNYLLPEKWSWNVFSDSWIDFQRGDYGAVGPAVRTYGFWLQGVWGTAFVGGEFHHPSRCIIWIDFLQWIFGFLLKLNIFDQERNWRQCTTCD